MKKYLELFTDPSISLWDILLYVAGAVTFARMINRVYKILTAYGYYTDTKQ